MRHASEPGPVQVADQVEVAVIAVAEAAVGDGGADRRGQVTEALHTDVPTAAKHRTRQPGVGELARWTRR